MSAELDGLVADRQIRQLAARYALAVDSRDLGALMELFVDDVDAGRWGTGRDALRAYYDETLRGFRRSVHFVGNHVIDLVDADHATGVVYCRADHEGADHWFTATFTYWDRYERRAGRWYFARRDLRGWFIDLLGHPDHEVVTRVPMGGGRRAGLPDAWESWARFWGELSEGP